MRPREISDYRKFAEVTGIMIGLKPVYGIDLEGDIGIDIFSPDSLPLLRDFVTAAPEYHIVSCRGATLINHVVVPAIYYLLACGDDDPGLYYPMSLAQVAGPHRSP